MIIKTVVKARNFLIFPVLFLLGCNAAIQPESTQFGEYQALLHDEMFPLSESDFVSESAQDLLQLPESYRAPSLSRFGRRNRIS